jgi:hypothetical protein
MNPPEQPSVFLPHGGCRKLHSYKVAEAAYDATVVFGRRFCAPDRRMSDQLVQAARSGVRNLSEGSGAAATSRKSEVQLTNVARASWSDELPRQSETEAPPATPGLPHAWPLTIIPRLCRARGDRIRFT